MQSEKQIAAAQGVLGRGGVYVGAELVKAALEAALSAAEPVGWFNRPNDVHGYQQVAKEYEGKLGTVPLYAAPPAPSVAVKELQWDEDGDNLKARMGDREWMLNITSDGKTWAGSTRPFVFGRNLTWSSVPNCSIVSLEEAKAACQADCQSRYAALSAQVQDDDERRTETCGRCQGNGEIVTDWERYRHPHDNDAGDEAVAECPDCDGIGKVSAQVQDVAGWQPIETAPKDGSKFIGFDGRRPFLCYMTKHYVKYPHEEGGPTFRDVWSGDYYDCISPEHPTHWMPLPAAPAKQEGGANE